MKRVLFADDNQETRDVVKALLTEAPFSLTLASSGLEALRLVRESYSSIPPVPYHLLVLDAAMPDLTGFNVIETLRSEGIEVPVVLFTADSTPLTHARAHYLGAPLWLKPDAVTNLENLITGMLCTT